MRSGSGHAIIQRLSLCCRYHAVSASCTKVTIRITIGVRRRAGRFTKTNDRCRHRYAENAGTGKEKGIDELDARIDEYAPLHFIRADAPPLLLITGDREKELLGRYEENAYMWRMMKLKGHQQTTLYELDGFDHGGMAHPAFPLLLNEIKRIEKLKNDKVKN